MTLLTPLGLLGLLGIVILIIIYIIKPNFQQKMISSTFVWKLSLRYRKKRIPTSKLRDLLIIICQVLILTLCALILSQPNQKTRAISDNVEVIAILDSSASMYTRNEDGVFRFERAIEELKELARETFENNGEVTVIEADNTPSFLVREVTAATQSQLFAALDALIDLQYEDEQRINCYYGESDMDAAILTANEVILGGFDEANNELSANLSAKIHIFTDKEFSYVNRDITVHNVAEEAEWNVAILSAEAVLEDNYFTVYCSVAVYGSNKDVGVSLAVTGANATAEIPEGYAVDITDVIVTCAEDITHNVVFRMGIIEESQRMTNDDNNTYFYAERNDWYIYSYKTINIQVLDPSTNFPYEDSYSLDDSFDIFEGERETLRIQYTSLLDPSISGTSSNVSSNMFINGMLIYWQIYYSDYWNIEIRDVRGGEPAIEGYDLYIYEHQAVPDALPTDGVIMLLDPYTAPSNAGFSIDRQVDFNKSLRPMEADYENAGHPLLNNVYIDSFEASRIVSISNYDASYSVLAWLNTDGVQFPALLAKKDGASQIVVIPYSVHFSNVIGEPDWLILMANIFDYYFPSTVTGNSFEIGQSAEFNARGPVLTIRFPDGQTQDLEVFPSRSAPFSQYGKYQLEQTTLFGKQIIEEIFVRCPMSESNIHAVGDPLIDQYTMEDTSDFYSDLLLYFAIALVSLLFVEWWLQSRGNM